MTQSSMHLPPLRQGRRVRHTEAADTGRAGPSAWPGGPSRGRRCEVRCCWVSVILRTGLPQGSAHGAHTPQKQGHRNPP